MTVTSDSFRDVQLQELPAAGSEQTKAGPAGERGKRLIRRLSIFRPDCFHLLAAPPYEAGKPGQAAPAANGEGARLQVVTPEAGRNLVHRALDGGVTRELLALAGANLHHRA